MICATWLPGITVQASWRLCSAVFRPSDLLTFVYVSLEWVHGWDKPMGGDSNLIELLIKLLGLKRPLALLCTGLEPLVGISAKGTSLAVI